MFEIKNSWYEPDDFLDVWECEIDNLRKELCEKLSQIVSIIYLEDFINILYFAFFEEENSALDLCEKYQIKDRHFYAFKNEKEKLIDCFIKREW